MAEAVWGLTKGSTYTLLDGTTFASPIVADVAGLVYPFRQGQWPPTCIGTAS